MYLVSISLAVGIAALLPGSFLIFAPAPLRKMNDSSARMIGRFDAFVFSCGIGPGISILLADAFLFFMASSFEKRLA